MRRSNLTLAVALILSAAVATYAAKKVHAQQAEQIKPYVVLILDISGSMDSPTGNGAPSCVGSVDTRFDHAKCAISNLVNTHGDITFGLGRFRHAAAGSCPGCNNGGINCDACNENNGVGCTPTMNSPDRFELIVPIIEDAAAFVLPWVDFACGGCTLDPADNPELDTTGFTPIGGSLRGVRRYFQGADPFYTAAMQPIYGAAAATPIHNDPLAEVFIAGEQCRPYVVITLTDGDETCEQFTGTEAAAASLLATPVTVNTVTRNYRIVTRPIGFGRAPGDTQIEGLAHAGGAADLPAQFEGFYANSEEELSLAFNEIIADSLKVEICNNIDDDCDGVVDEGFQKWCDEDGGEPSAIFCAPVADDCDNNDDNCVAGTSDEPKNACGGCGTLTEICNLLDDDCDGTVDENVCGGCVPQGAEICDNDDDDCDGFIDENLTRPCGTDVGECVAGIETCNAGNFESCTAIGGSSESCDGLDNDCDGTIDGFAQACNVIPGNDPPFPGPCQAGTQVCPADGSGTFDACIGEIGPGTEGCDGIDNDCDGPIDEGTGGQDCSSSCGIGVTVCRNGLLECDAIMTPEPEICDGVDNDCDGTTDEGVPEGAPCDPDGDLCEPGMDMCIAGQYECIGGVASGTEICDCIDNDCDGSTDEEPPPLCGGGASCVSCQCALPCGTGEQPCLVGQFCDQGFCLVDPCYMVDCPPIDDAAQVCDDGACVAACSLADCDDGFVCRPVDGSCQRDDCVGFPERCSETELCVAGACEPDPCSGINCAADEYCQNGTCVGSCAGVECPAGQSCQLGVCAIDRCLDVECTPGGVCNPETGVCQLNACINIRCDVGEVCDPITGECVRDPCLGVECPEGQSCDDGSCFDDSEVDPEDDDEYVSAGGGGGCSVGGGGAAGFIAVLLALLALARRREDDFIDEAGE